MTTPDEISVAQQTIEGYLSKWRVSESNLRAAVATNVTMQDSLARAVAERQSMYLELIDARNEIDRLRKLIPAKPAPHITFCLSNPDPKIGNLMERTYSSSGIGVTTFQYPVVHSFKKYVKADVDNWVKRAPTGTVVIFFHEPEDNIEKGTLTISALQEQTISLCQSIIDNGRVGQVTPATCFMQYSLAAVGPRATSRLKMVTDIMSPAVVAKLKEAKGIGGWDVYAGPGADDGPDRDPETLFGGPAAFSKGLGLPWAVFESGASHGPTSPDDLHAAWWQRVFDFFGGDKIAQPPLYMTNWNAPAPGTDKSYSVANQPKTLAVWQAAIKKYA